MYWLDYWRWWWRPPAECVPSVFSMDQERYYVVQAIGKPYNLSIWSEKFPVKPIQDFICAMMPTTNTTRSLPLSDLSPDNDKTNYSKFELFSMVTQHEKAWVLCFHNSVWGLVGPNISSVLRRTRKDSHTWSVGCRAGPGRVLPRHH